MGETLKGRFRADWWVFCGGCGFSEWLDSVEAQKIGGLPNLAKIMCWKYRKTHGWLCPDCISRMVKTNE